EVQRHDGDALAPDVLPNVELGPVRKREHPDALARTMARVVERPELGALLARVPAVLRRAEREDALLGTAPLLVTPRATEGGVEAVAVERLAQRLRLHHVGVNLRPVCDRVDAARQSLLVHVHDQ